MRVLLVEDSEFVRTQFLRLFEGLDFLEIVGYADSEEDAVQAVRRFAPPSTLMHWTRRAPELSATSRLVRIWIMLLLPTPP